MSTDLDDLKFEDAVPPDLSGLPPLPQTDEAPAVDDAPTCRVCGKELVYAGRGRKPVYCDEHRKASGKRTTVPKAGSNDKLAGQATEALVQINRLTGFGARIIGLTNTAETIAFTEEGFREQAYAALVTDPALCKQILSAGQISAKFSLAIAYATMLGMVGPVAVMEVKAKRLAKAEAEAESAETE